MGRFTGAQEMLRPGRLGSTPNCRPGLRLEPAALQRVNSGGVLLRPEDVRPARAALRGNPRRPGLWLELTPPLRVNSAGIPCRAADAPVRSLVGAS